MAKKLYVGNLSYGVTDSLNGLVHDANRKLLCHGVQALLRGFECRAGPIEIRHQR